MSVFNGISVNVYDKNLDLVGAVENVISASATRPLDRIGSGSYTMPVPSAGAGYAQRDLIAHVYTYNSLLAANQTIAIFLIKSIVRRVPTSGQAVFDVSGPDMLHELTYRSIGENVIATNVQDFLAASAYGKQTTLTAQANAGSTTITVASASGWAIGDLVDVRLNSNSWHTATITNIAGSVITLSSAIPTGQQANIDNVARTRILKITLWDATDFITDAVVTVDLYPAGVTHTTTIANISGTTVTLTAGIPETRAASAGNPVAYPAGITALTNDATSEATTISVADVTDMTIGDAISIRLDTAAMTHSALISNVSGNVITLSAALPWGRVAPYQYVVRSKRPADDDIEQIMDFAPATWTNPGGGTPNGSYIVGAGETVYQALEQARQQGGGHFRMAYTGAIVRQLQWLTSPDSSGITLVQPDSATHADMTDTSKGVILSFEQDFSEQQKEPLTRIYARNANNETFTAAEGFVTPAGGLTVSWASGLITNSTAESGGAARIERHIRYDNIRPEDDTEAAALQAAITLYKTAEAQLLDAQNLPKFFNITCITHSAVGIKPYQTVLVTYDGPGFSFTNESLTVLEVQYRMGQDGILYTHLVATDLVAADTQQIGDADYVAGSIRKHDMALRHLARNSSGSTAVSGGGVTQHHDLLGLEDDDHPLYLREDGGRALSGNLAVDSGITIDGVDISAHAADPTAHHALVTAGNGIAVSGQQVSVDLASPSGLEFGSGDLRIADTIAGDGLSIASKILAINLASPSGLEIASDALRLNDTVAGAGLTISSKVLAVGAGSGITVNADDVALTTPGTLSVSSSNNAAGNHTHAVTASDNPGAATQLLKSSASGHLQLVRLGLQVAPAVPLHVAAATEQLRIEYNGSNYTSFTADSTGTLTVAPTNSLNLYPAGDVVFDPGGKDLLPLNNYDLNIGLINKKYLTLHAAELWVETLVAQNTIATIGGRILVGPTTTFTRDISGAQTYIFTKHNQAQHGHIQYSEAAGSVEFFSIDGLPIVAVTPGVNGVFFVDDDWAAFFVNGQPFRIEQNVAYNGDWTVANAFYNSGTNRTEITISGTIGVGVAAGYIVVIRQSVNEYCYPVITRNLDGSGANTWYAGDALFNTGTTGNGFIDLYSIAGVLSGAGPTIVGNVRTGTAYNQWLEHWAIGNLNGLYGYGADTYGAAVGKYSSTTSYLTADETNGIRIMRGTVQKARWFANGDLLIGEEAASRDNILITNAGAISVRNNTTERIGITAAGILTIKNSSGNAVFTFDSSAGAEFTLPLTLGTDGGIWQGTGTFASPTTGLKIWRDGSVGRLATYSSSTVQIEIDTAGKLLAGGGKVELSSSGISLNLDGTDNPNNTIKGIDGLGTATSIGSISSASLRRMSILVQPGTSKDAEINIRANGGTGRYAYCYLTANGGSSGWPRLLLESPASGTASYAYLYSASGSGDPVKFGINNTTPAAILDIQQATNDDPVLLFRSSGDVAHGMTGLFETDVYGAISKNSSANGGLAIQAFADTGSTSMVQFGTAVSADTAKSTAAVSPFIIAGYLKSGTTRDVVSANGNVLVVRSGTNTRFIVDAEGDIHYDGTAATYDEHDDVSLLRAINLAVNPAGLIRDEFDRFVSVNREMLAAANLVTFNEDGRHFVNLSGIQRLVMGAMWQMHKRIAELETQLKRN